MSKSRTCCTKKYLILIVSILAFIFFSLINFSLLSRNLINGSDFANLEIAITVSCFVLYLLPRIQELSLGGYLIKLDKANKEALATIEQLKLAKTGFFRVWLMMVRAKQIGFTDGGKFLSQQVELFLEVYKQIQQEDLLDILRNDVKTSIDYLMREIMVNVGYKESPAPSMEVLEHFLKTKDDSDDSDDSDDYTNYTKNYQELYESYKTIYS